MSEQHTPELAKEILNSSRESHKLVYDIFKHITTLASGTIIVLATFIEKVFKTPVWIPLVVITFVGLILAVASALAAMTFMAKQVRNPVVVDQAHWAVKATALCVGSFLMALICLTIFTIRNFLV